MIQPSGVHRGAFAYAEDHPHLARVRESVALFDFRYLPMEKSLILAEKWHSSFTALVGPNRTGVWLTLDPTKLPNPVEIIRPTQENLGHLCLFHLESHHRGSVPHDCILSEQEMTILERGEIFLRQI